MHERLPETAADASADIRKLYIAPPELPALRIPETRPVEEWELASVPEWLGPGPNKAWRPHFMIDERGKLYPRVSEGFRTFPINLSPVERMLINALMVAGPDGIVERDFIGVADYIRYRARTPRQYTGKSDIEELRQTINMTVDGFIATRKSPIFQRDERFRRWSFGLLATVADKRIPKERGSLSPLAKPTSHKNIPEVLVKPKASEKSLSPEDTQELGKLLILPPASRRLKIELEEPPEPLKPLVPEGFEDFIKEYFPRVVGMVRSRLNTSEWMSPEDVAQEVCIRSWRHFEQLDKARSMTGWLFKVANNVIVDAVRHRQSRAEEVLSDLPSEETFPVETSPGAEEAALKEASSGLDADLAAFLDKAVDASKSSIPSDELIHMLVHIKLKGYSLNDYVALHTKTFGDRYKGKEPLRIGTVKSRMHYVVEKLKAQGDVIKDYLERGRALEVDTRTQTAQKLEKLAPVVVDSKEKVIAEDSQKQPLTSFSYVEISYKGHSALRYLDLDTPQDILAMRILMSLKKVPAIRTNQGRLMQAESFKNYIWNSMPLAERRLFVKADNEDEMYGNAQPIRDDLVGLLNRLTKPTGYGQVVVLPSEVQGTLLHPRGIEYHSTLFMEPRQRQPHDHLFLP